MRRRPGRHVAKWRDASEDLRRGGYTFYQVPVHIMEYVFREGKCQCGSSSTFSGYIQFENIETDVSLLKDEDTDVEEDDIQLYTRTSLSKESVFSILVWL